MSDVVSTFEAAQIIGCSSDNVRRLVRAGVLVPVISTRAGKLLSRADVERHAEKQAAERRAAADRKVERPTDDREVA